MTDDSFATRFGPWAVVTGAGQGIGAAFATALVHRACHVVLVDRDAGLIASLANGLRANGGNVIEVVVDLSGADGAEAVLTAIEGLDVGLLVNNAALSMESPFLEQPLERLLTQLDVNCRVPLTLVRTLLPTMVAKERGGIILLSSQSAMRGAPLVAGYAATKAWNLILAESLSDEMRDAGVAVLAVLPGSTRTPGWEGSRPQSSLGTAHVMSPAEVAEEALESLGHVPSIIIGQANREAEAFMASVPRPEAIRLMGDVMRTMYPPQRDTDPAV